MRRQGTDESESVAQPTAVLDANVLYPSFLRDVFMRVAVAGVYHARWTNAIHEEWMRNVLEDYADMSQQHVERIRDRMDKALPDALVSGYESLIPHMARVHPKDRHVAAAAVHAGASHLVTWNTRDFLVAALSPYSLVPATPDDFLSQLMHAYDPIVSDTLERHRKGLVKPKLTRREYRIALIAHGLVKMAGDLG